MATGAALVALIITFGPISGAHFNPVVTLAEASQGGLPWREVPGLHRRAGRRRLRRRGGRARHVQAAGAVLRLAARRDGIAQLVSEFVATFGLLAVIWGCGRRQPRGVPFAVGAYITAAYWFTSSTSFANPAVTLARAASDTFAGIRPVDAPGLHRRPARRRRRRHGAFSDGWSPAQGADASSIALDEESREHRDFRLHPQRRALADGGGLVQAAGRSGEGARHLGRDRPGTRVHPEVLEAMREVGVDLARSQAAEADRRAGRAAPRC